MGYAFCWGECANCHRRFAFNPTRVPSVRVAGRRQPICRHCMAWVNAERRGKGLPDFKVPADAYEACPEKELI